jgi:hypothetical protein
MELRQRRFVLVSPVPVCAAFAGPRGRSADPNRDHGTTAGGKVMKTLSAVMSLAAVLTIAGIAGASAAPSSPAIRLEVAPGHFQHVQYGEYRTRHGVVKCFRDFVVGPYRCHYYRSPL